MALRAVVDHPKFHNLTQRLGVERWGGLGVLEAMWHFCGKFTPAGDIGKYSDAEIEAWIGWKGEPGVLIAVLVQCRWIDRHEVYRLVVHDWHLHADYTTKLALKRAGLGLIVPTVSRQRGDSVATESRLPEPGPVPGSGPVPVPENGLCNKKKTNRQLGISPQLEGSREKTKATRHSAVSVSSFSIDPEGEDPEPEPDDEGNPSTPNFGAAIPKDVDPPTTNGFVKLATVVDDDEDLARVRREQVARLKRGAA